MERLDKILANLGYGTRKEVKALVKKGYVNVNEITVKDSSMKVDPYKDKIEVDGKVIKYRKFIYLMMNKPEGVVSATFDNYDETIIDLIDEEYKAFDPFPVGRLDKDTVGLILITNDGELNHKLISPKNHVDKVYFAQINKEVTQKDVKAFEKGIILDDEYKCMPGKLEILDASSDGSNVLVTIQEGKFHQVKRMFESRDKEVVYLKRESFGPLKLDKDLEEGCYRELTEEEINILKNI